MERRGANTWIVAVLAVAVGFLVALLIFGGDDSSNTSATVDTTDTSATTTAATTAATTTATDGVTTTSTTTSAPAPTDAQPTVDSCINLWNQSNNSTNQAFLVNQANKQPVRVNVAVTTDVPPKCQVTIVGNNGDAFVFPEAGGSTYPYAQAPGTTTSASLPATQKTSNALEQSDGTIKAR